MFLKNLMNINKEFNLPPSTLQILNEELTMLRPDTTISPHYLYRKTKVSTKIIKSILIELSFVSPYIKENFILTCSNDDPDMVHVFEFEDNKTLKEFIVHNQFKCTECHASLAVVNIRIFFKKINLPTNKAL